jgi:hypothetical protein
MTSPLDRPLTITVFSDIHALSKDVSFVTLRDFSERMRNERAPTKAQLSLFSMCSYDNNRTVKKSLRHDANVRECFCVTADHDGGTLSLADAADAVHRAGLAAVLATTSRYTKERPRWRVIVPLSDPLHCTRTNAAGLALADYGRLVSRLAGIFPDNTLTLESWTLSQSWYFGSIDGAVDHGVLLLDGDAS